MLRDKLHKIHERPPEQNHKTWLREAKALVNKWKDTRDRFMNWESQHC